MSEKIRIAKATTGILRALGYSVDAVEYFKKKKYKEGMQDVAQAVGTVVRCWDDIDYTWNQLKDAVDQIWGTNYQSVVAVVQAPDFEHGFFTGKWFSSDRRQVELLYHNSLTNAISLCSPKATSPGYSVYTGGIDLELGVLVWTGYNSTNHQLLIIGTPDYGGDNIYCHTWYRDPKANQFNVVEQFSISRM
jgi:hypothetical protein